jgi:hypothetical protein
MFTGAGGRSEIKLRELWLQITMNNLIPTDAHQSTPTEYEVDIPIAFRQAFAPTPVERTAKFVKVALRSICGWLRGQSEQVWLPRTIDPIAELKHVYLGEYGVLSTQVGGSSPRRCCSDLPTCDS